MYIGMKEKQKRLSLSLGYFLWFPAFCKGFLGFLGFLGGFFRPRVLWVSEGVPRGSLGSLVVPWGF